MPDREKVIETLESCVANPLHRKGDKFVISFDVRFVNAIIELLKEQEAVVHCKDCKHWQRRECGGYGTCDYGYLDGFFDADWFCANGERKEWR